LTSYRRAHGLHRAPLDAFAGQTVRIRFQAVDGGANNLVEVELDDIRVTRPS
jgi:hypothetical protein